MTLLHGVLAAMLIAAGAAQTDLSVPPDGAKAVLTLRGVGVQIYACKDGAKGAAWTFVAPQAKLFERGGQGTEAGTHSAGPIWTLKDGSSVKGELLATQPSPDPNAIPWLLLKAAQTQGTGALAQVQYIRRSDTTGGKAPATGCDAKHLDAASRVPYQATYTFYVAAP